MNINEMRSKQMTAVTRLSARWRFSYNSVNTWIFRYFQLEILYRMLNAWTHSRKS